MNIFVIMACVILFLYLLFIFVFFIPSFGFGMIPLIVIGSFGFFSIIIATCYVNYDPNNDFTSSDNVYLISMTVIVIVAYVIIMFAVWLIYTQYGKNIDPKFEGLEAETHLEDRIAAHPDVTPFTMNHK